MQHPDKAVLPNKTETGEVRIQVRPTGIRNKVQSIAAKSGVNVHQTMALQDSGLLWDYD